MEQDMRVLLNGIDHLAATAAKRPQVSVAEMDDIKEQVAKRLEEVIARRIEQATGSRP